AAPIDIVFDTLVSDQGGPLGDMKLTLEAWPGGRWYRDLGNNTGHLWGHVQVIKPPKLLEIIGPMFMSYPVASFLQYRLTEEGGGTKLTLTHQAFGMIPPEHLEGVNKGWGEISDSIKAKAEAKQGK
ncbi:MAG TPA: SRPBCC domain-containing protein, partial [Pirellulales bacterium]